MAHISQRIQQVWFSSTPAEQVEFARAIAHELETHSIMEVYQMFEHLTHLNYSPFPTAPVDTSDEVFPFVSMSDLLDDEPTTFPDHAGE